MYKEKKTTKQFFGVNQLQQMTQLLLKSVIVVITYKVLFMQMRL